MSRQVINGNLELKLQKAVGLISGTKDIAAFYLFGSYASGRPTPISDIDFAVLFDNSVNRDQFLTRKLQLMGDLSTVAGIDKIDLVILNEAPPGLGYRVVKDGRLLFLRDEAKAQLVAFKVRVLDRYFDYQPVQKVFSEGLSRRIKEGKFGGGPGKS
ncbi:MAG: type VII toxin-antitoxin system MntA family adenylyltransferase antitoxin [Bacillota bacterium]